MLERLWPTIVTGGWDQKADRGARFMRVGTNNRAIFEGMLAGVRFANAIGPERIFARIHQLAKQVRDRAAEAPYLELLTPDDERLYGCLVTVVTKGIHRDKFFALCRERKMWVTGGERMRISAHIHTRPSDLDRLFETFHECRT
jgi:selenocysteine lyase/cysteine desulfurase